MSNHTAKPSAIQRTLDMFNDNPVRRDKEQAEIVTISQEYEFPLQRCILPDGREMYAIQDWVAGVAQTDNPRRFWSDLKKRMKKIGVELYASCVQLPYKSSDGKNYQVDYADGQTIYGITQHMGVDTGIRNQVLSHLAKTGAFVDAVRRDKEQAEIAINLSARQDAIADGKDPAWIAVREMGKVTRKQLTALIMGLNPHTRLDIVTNNVYTGVLGDTADGLNAQLGLKPKSNPRDHLSRLALIYTMAGEETVRLHLSSYADGDVVPATVIYATVKTISLTVGKQAQDVARQLNIDLVTGRALLGDAYYAWLAVSQSEDDIDNDEYRAWKSALVTLGSLSVAYIDHYIHRFCMSPSNRPKEFPVDPVQQQALALIAKAEVKS